MNTNLKFQISNFKFLLVVLGGVGVCAGLRPGLVGAARYQPAFVMNDQVAEEVNTSSFALILGEVRASMADLMWVKTERYLHRGVAYKPHLDADTMARTGEIARQTSDEGRGTSEHVADDANIIEHEQEPEHEAHAHEADHEHEHEEGESLVALVPDRMHDYRGFVGTLHRAIQPWKGPDEPDEHTAGDELVPWYRMLTYSDPHHWRGYLIGTWWLSKIKDENAVAEAERFIAEGIRNNPEAFQLHLMRGRLRIRQERWREAVGCFERAVAMGLKVRPAGGKEQPPVWNESAEEDFAAALRYIPALQLHRLNEPAAARASLERGLGLIPGDGPLRGLKAQMDAEQ